MGERRRKVYILEQEIKIEINQEMFNFCSHLPDSANWNLNLKITPLECIQSTPTSSSSPE